MNGFDLASRIRKSSWEQDCMPIIIVTGRDDRRTMQEAFEMEQLSFSRNPWTDKS